jgi:galactokinase
MTEGHADAGAEAQWQRFVERVRERETGLFDGDGPVIGARAPGRLDVMGGVADYSGSVVLEGTIAEATFAAVQTRQDGLVVVRSASAAAEGFRPEVSIPITTLLDGIVVRPFPEVSAALQECPGARWSAYVTGCLYVLMASGWLETSEMRGVSILVDGAVPIGAGVSSSAALEVAVMSALCGLYSIQMDGVELARLCQIVENRVVGAPCGIMDQVTCALGREASLLVLKCQPHEILGHQAIPSGWKFIGLDSGVKHSVGGSKYGLARTAAFMGLKIIQGESGQDLGGYLCNLSPEAWLSWRERLPETMTGAEFTLRYGDLPDTVTTVRSDETYRVRAAAEHPILEDNRVREFIALLNLAGSEPDTQIMTEAGALMVEAHRSYSDRIDLGSPETDLLVELAMGFGPEGGIYGAKITGGGSGGTVAILCDGTADTTIEEIRRSYEQRTGIRPYLMVGSSPGAVAFGTKRVG